MMWRALAPTASIRRAGWHSTTSASQPWRCSIRMSTASWSHITRAVARHSTVGPPISRLSAPAPARGNDDFTLTQNEVAGARTDFLQIFSEDWVAGSNHFATADLTDRTFSAPGNRLNAYWYEGTGGTVPAGGIDTWNSLTYFKPTSFIDHTDPNVTSRSSDYRLPDDISGADFAFGSRWDEDGK